MNKKYTVLLVVSIIFLICLAVGSLGCYAGWFDGKNVNDEVSEKENIVSEQAISAGNSLYKNFLLSYRIEYPSDAKIEDFSKSRSGVIENSDCVKISTENYFVVIGKKESEDISNSACFGSTRKDDWQIAPSETINIAGRSRV